MPLQHSTFLLPPSLKSFFALPSSSSTPIKVFFKLFS
jgi:hypothetical protein